jgi:hypothetical protein
MRTPPPLIVTLLLPLSLVAFASTEDAYIDAARETSAQTLDRELPAVPIETWLQGLAGEGAHIVWEVNDCGEQTGTAADATRDFPVCVEAETGIPERGVFHVRISVGTVQHGLVAERGLSAAYVQRANGQIEWFKTLSELAGYVRSGRR